MKNVIKFCVIILSLFIISCNSILVSLITKKDIISNILIYENKTGNRIVFLPVVHIGKDEYFKSIKFHVDSLRKKKYLILHEGVITKNSNDTIRKKFRKVAGFNLSNYKDVENKSIPKALKNKKYTHQTFENNGIIDGDINVDYSLDSLIYFYEKNYKEIRLNDCDYETSLSSKYSCKDKVVHSKYYLLNTIRNDKVKKIVNKYKLQNVVLIYGKGHRYMFHADFTDNGYTLIKGKL